MIIVDCAVIVECTVIVVYCAVIVECTVIVDYDRRFVLAFVLFAGTAVKLRQLWLERDKLMI